jgi:uncharacterized Zn finger protein
LNPVSRYYGSWAPYVPVARRRHNAERITAALRKSGQVLTPVAILGRAIAATVWGKAWCSNIESYRDYETRLPRGRSYVRNGSVIDLQIAPGQVTALVSGSEIYQVAISIKNLQVPRWKSICNDCAGSIDSLVELLQGRFSKSVMERLCHQQTGLFPNPSDIRFSCSCPDHALMCKHVAAVLYGVGARLDQEPELLFRLRAVDHTELVARSDTALPLIKQAPAAGKVLNSEDVSVLFGLEMAEADVSTAELPRGKHRSPPARPTKAEPKRRRSVTKTVKPRIFPAKAAVPKPAPASVKQSADKSADKSRTSEKLMGVRKTATSKPASRRQEAAAAKPTNQGHGTRVKTSHKQR